MLKVKSKEQWTEIGWILRDTPYEKDGDGGVRINGCVSFDTLAEMVDFIRSVNKQKKGALDISIVSPQMMHPVETWLAYKKERHESYKPTGFKTFYRKLCEMSGDNPKTAMMIIEQSM